MEKKKRRSRLLLAIVSLLLLMQGKGVCEVKASQTPYEATDRTYLFELTANGKGTVTVQPGGLITISLRLKRTDAKESYPMYAMQDEIHYDSDFFTLEEDNTMTASGIQTRDLALRGEKRAFYMNFLSVGGGETWEADTFIGNFTLRVKATSGTTRITNESCIVSYADGQGSYLCETADLTVILSSECSVRFETGGGSLVGEEKVYYGELLGKPEDPVREGYVFQGWFRDIDGTQEWNFATDTVQENMTLYAKWQKAQDEIPDQPQTSAYPSWILWILLLLLLLGLLVITFFVWKRHRPQNKRNDKMR